MSLTFLDWAKLWRHRRSFLAVRSDSVVAITLLVHCRAAGDSTALVARECALDMAEGIYTPDVGSHLPGIANTTADMLSRW